MTYYTSTNSHKKAKVIIDYINIGLTICVGIIFIFILILRSRSGILFSVEFFAGATINLLSGIKNIFEKKRKEGIGLIITAVFLYLMAVIFI